MKSRYTQLSLALLVVLAVVAIPVVMTSQKSLQTMFNAPLRWIPQDSPALEEFNEFLTQFDSYEIVLISWPGCTIDDERLRHFGELVETAQVDRQEQIAEALISNVATGYELVRQLMDAPSSLSREVAIKRLQGNLVGPDGMKSCAAVSLTDFGSQHRDLSLELLFNAAEEATGLPREEIHAAGPAMNGYAIDSESLKSIAKFAAPSTLISLVLCCICLRSIWLSLPIVIVGAIGQGTVLSIVWLMGGSMNAILTVMPALVFVLTVSAGIHLVHYFFDEIRSGKQKGAVTRALQNGWRPCVLAAVTTAIGLASLIVSDVIPVQQFGAIAAFGVLMTMVLLFGLLPGAMETWLRWWGDKQQKRVVPTARTENDFWSGASAVLARHARLVRVVGLGMIFVLGAGLVYVRTSVSITALLAEDNPSVQDYHWFEEQIGPLVPVEVVLHFPPAPTDSEEGPDRLARMEIAQQVQEQINSLDMVDGAISAAALFPEIPQFRGLRATSRRNIFGRKIDENLQDLVDANYINVTADAEFWRISARVHNDSKTDYGVFLEELRAETEPIVASYLADHNFTTAVETTVTGVTSVAHEVQHHLMTDLFFSFVTALVLVGVVMMVALGGFWPGIIAMAPNVFPTAVLFGLMGWMGRKVDIGMMMTASVALGIAVDGTFHFLRWFRQETGAGRSQREAVEYSFRHCGKALVQTTIVCACGLMAYTFSGFLPARNFAWMMLMLLTTALVGDLVLLPALLLGPWGKLLMKSSRTPVGQGIPAPHVATGAAPATIEKTEPLEESLTGSHH